MCSLISTRVPVDSHPYTIQRQHPEYFNQLTALSLHLHLPTYRPTELFFYRIFHWLPNPLITKTDTCNIFSDPILTRVTETYKYNYKRGRDELLYNLTVSLLPASSLQSNKNCLYKTNNTFLTQ
jgi:hypothetical protein